MPVVHGHAIQELRRSCEIIKSVCPDVSKIGVGGLVPLLQSGGSVANFRYRRCDGSTGDRADWIGDAIGLVREAFPGALVHVFGIGSTTTAIAVLALGASSVDSLAWRRVASYGAILLPGCSERFPTNNPDRVASRPVLSQEEQALVMRCGCPACTPFGTASQRAKALASTYKNRALHNAWTLLTEVDLLRAAIRSGQPDKFLKSRIRKQHRLYKPVARLRGWTEAE